jgi:hypothetical protein
MFLGNFRSSAIALLFKSTVFCEAFTGLVVPRASKVLRFFFNVIQVFYFIGFRICVRITFSTHALRLRRGVLARK